MTTRTVELYCPSTKTKAEFIISPYQPFDQVLHSIGLLLGLQDVALYSALAKPITDLKSIHDDQRILVAATASEVMLPDSPYEFEFYDGQESDEVDPDSDVFGKDWAHLEENEKCEHIASLIKLHPTSRNKLRITRSYDSIKPDFALVNRESFNDKPTLEKNIKQRWGMAVDQFLADWIRSEKSWMARKTIEDDVLAGLNLLSSLTHGQSHLAGEYLDRALKIRLEDDEEEPQMIQATDIVNAITMIYECAGVIPAKLTKPKTLKQREKAKLKAQKQRRKATDKRKSDSTGDAEE